MYILNLICWKGRLGNNLWQLSNAVCYAKKTKSVLYFPKHSIIKNFVFDFREDFQINIEKESDFWDLKEFADFNVEECNNQRREILKNYILDLLPYEKKINNYDLTVHIRGGDIFDSPHNYYVQTPLSYFLKIFELEKAKNILLVCEDKKNPIVNLLLNDKRYNCYYQSENIETDINYILNSKKFVIGGISTFALCLLLCSREIDKVFFPIFENDFINFRKSFITETKTIDVKLKDYIKIGEWNFDKKQESLMINFPSENVILG